jgi:hypothetical protein
MRGPHVRFCERRRGVILCAYSTLMVMPHTVAEVCLAWTLDWR